MICSKMEITPPHTYTKGVIFLTVKTNINFKHLIIAVVIPLAVGGISSLIVGSGFDFYSEAVTKPPLSPPDWLFPVMWTILYILMGISSYLVYEKDKSEAKQPLAVYAIQLAMNFMWPIFFFSLISCPSLLSEPAGPSAQPWPHPRQSPQRRCQCR